MNSDNLKKAIKSVKADKGEAKLVDLQAKLSELTEQLQRERADAMNVRRRAEEEKLGMASFYKSLTIGELLNFIDSFDRALKHAPSEASPKWQDWFRGVESTKKQLDEALIKLGVERIKTVGEHFDPYLHEAVSMEEGDGKEEIISEELQSGYKLGDQVLRHAMVKVTK